MRYKDAEAGWRTIPDLNGAGDDKVPVSSTAVFHIDTDTATVTLEEKGSKVPLGRQVVYMVAWAGVKAERWPEEGSRLNSDPLSLWWLMILSSWGIRMMSVCVCVGGGGAWTLRDMLWF